MRHRRQDREFPPICTAAGLSPRGHNSSLPVGRRTRTKRCLDYTGSSSIEASATLSKLSVDSSVALGSSSNTRFPLRSNKTDKPKPCKQRRSMTRTHLLCYSSSSRIPVSSAGSSVSPSVRIRKVFLISSNSSFEISYNVAQVLSISSSTLLSSS